MGRRFFEASGLARWFSFDAASFEATLGRLLRAPDAVVFIAETDARIVGMAAAVAYGAWFDTGHQTAQELFWWVEPEHRGGRAGPRLLGALEGWAVHRGCRTFEMGALDSSGGAERLADHYARRGYAPKERIFVKVL